MVISPEGPNCAGVHLGQPFAGYKQIDWQPPTHWTTTGIRVRFFTCSCRTVAYEFGQVGGSYVIQRTIKAADGLIIERTMPTPWTDAHELWLSIFLGTAR